MKPPKAARCGAPGAHQRGDGCRKNVTVTVITLAKATPSSVRLPARGTDLGGQSLRRAEIVRCKNVTRDEIRQNGGRG
jgi:hypothetical protein